MFTNWSVDGGRMRIQGGFGMLSFCWMSLAVNFLFCGVCTRMSELLHTKRDKSNPPRKTWDGLNRRWWEGSACEGHPVGTLSCLWIDVVHNPYRGPSVSGPLKFYRHVVAFVLHP